MRIREEMNASLIAGKRNIIDTTCLELTVCHHLKISSSCEANWTKGKNNDWVWWKPAKAISSPRILRFMHQFELNIAHIYVPVCTHSYTINICTYMHGSVPTVAKPGRTDGWRFLGRWWPFPPNSVFVLNLLAHASCSDTVVQTFQFL